MALLLLAALLAWGSDRDPVRIEDGVRRHGVVGVRLLVDVDEAAALDRRGSRLDPARHMVRLRLRAEDGRVLHEGRAVPGAAPGVNGVTTTPPLPADDGRHVFFVPHHRLDVEPGRAVLQADVLLDPGPDQPPVVLLEGYALAVDVPAVVVTRLRTDPGVRAGTCPDWRVRVGRDVVLDAPAAEAVVVASPGDPLAVDVEPCGAVAWRPHRPSDLPIRQRREELPRARLHGARVSPARTKRAPALEVALDWRDGGAGLTLGAPLEVDLGIAVEDGPPVPVPARPDPARPTTRLLVPGWALPASAGRKGWTLHAALVARAGPASPLSRDVRLAVGRAPIQPPPEVPVTRLMADPVDVRLTEEPDGLGLRVEAAWTLPSELVDPGLPGGVGWTARWADGRGAARGGSWRACPDGCEGPWRLGTLDQPRGRLRATLPLAWIADDPSPPAVRLAVSRPGTRGLEATIPVSVALPERHAVILRPRRARLTCRTGSQARLVVSAQGVELAATAPRPCATTVRWDRDDTLVVPAFAGDRLDVDLRVDGRTLRRDRIRVSPGDAPIDLAEPTAGVDRARITARVE
jgi:hypothetical protein